MDSQAQGGEEQHLEPEVAPKGALALREEEVLEFWNKEEIFKKSLQKPAPKGDYVFYDGPPFATGLPHFGHMLPTTIKDAIPRYRTMCGYRVERRWGWDCHGLPLENQIEKELGFKTKRDIEQYGVEKFNEAARTAVLRYAEDWRRIIPRLGRWVDMDDDYRTMDATYTESVWWAFKNLHSRGLVYEGFKAMHLCPRCGTTLSNFEVAQGYLDIQDIAVVVKLPLVDEPETSLLIWTTTPWTLPGNTAAAVNAAATYVKARTDEGFVIVAKELAEKVLGPEPKLYGEILGKDLVGRRYTPPFNYFVDQLHKHKTHAWKIYAAPYVTLQDGTGIVHLAPAYGAEDLELAQKEKIPLIHHVTDDGKFIATVADFAHLPVKPKGRHMETDAKIVEHLQQRGLLFHQEKITHSYPHCWRCDTPLLNWAANSWFVKVSDIKKKLIEQNSKVRWVPAHIGSGRFDNLLKNAPDWAISRSRYWGAPIPVWRHSKTKEIKVVGSVDDLLGMVRRSGNQYFVMRHGEAKSNIDNKEDIAGDPANHLTQKGREEVLAAAHALSSKKIDMIITSPFLRTKETAQLLAQTLGLPDSAVMLDTRLGEVADVTTTLCRTVGEFIFEVERRYAGKNILIISHGGSIWALQQVAARKSKDGFAAALMLKTGQWTQLPFTPYPHNDEYELDLHRPYIDDIALGDAIKGEWKRVPDVFDCWFESGSMPYASNHYPFTNKNKFNPRRLLGIFPKGYPANFISESIDQTRGWFYSLIVLGVGLFGRSPYTNVITNGTVLAEDGRKMSKRLKNYPDLLETINRFSADAVRYFLLSSSVIRGEDVSFSLRGVEEVSKKLLMRLDNVRSFYDLYTPPKLLSQKSSAAPRLFAQEISAASSSAADVHVLDRWILSRLGELVRDTTAGFESYELDAATRPLAGFIDDLSTWYLRRSRDRFKTEDDASTTLGAGKAQALAVLRHVLLVTAHAMAPVMPFFADDLYRRLRSENDPQSVHLSNWPLAGAVDEVLLKDMQRVRDIASQGLELRERAGIKIRQPLGTLKVTQLPADVAFHALIADELNVKQVVEDPSQQDEVWLDTNLTPELKEEGLVRDLIRRVQEWRKKEGLQIADRPAHTLVVTPEEEPVATKHRAAIMAAAGLASLDIHA